MDRERGPQVYVVVLNWNNYADTKKCLESLQQTTYRDLKIIVVDNGSADGSGKRLEAEFPQYHFILNNKNLGFARGCNVGILAALKDVDCAYVLLLNNDSVVVPELLEKAVQTAEADKRIGIIGGKLLDSVETKRIAYAGGSIDRFRAGCRMRGSFKVDRGQYDMPEETGYVTGALMLIRREVLERVGLLPEEYFFGVEDVDYSFNVRQSGYKLYYVPEFVAYHKGEGSHWNYDPKFSYNGYRSRFIFQEKYLPHGLFAIWKKLFVIYEKHLARFILQLALRKYGYSTHKDAPYDDIEFALNKAVEDHGKDVLSEETLNRFEQVLKRRKTTITNKPLP